MPCPLFKEEDYVKNHRFTTQIKKQLGGVQNLTWVRLVRSKGIIKIATGTDIDLATGDGIRVPMEFARLPNCKDDYYEAAKKLVDVFGKEGARKLNVAHVTQMVSDLFHKQPKGRTQVLKIYTNGSIELSVH